MGYPAGPVQVVGWKCSRKIGSAVFLQGFSFLSRPNCLQESEAGGDMRVFVKMSVLIFLSNLCLLTNFGGPDFVENMRVQISKPK